MVDNTIWGRHGRRPERDDSDTVAIRAFNDAVAADPRVRLRAAARSRDGLTLLRKR